MCSLRRETSVRLVRQNSSFVAACFGILALSLNALVPIHLVFDLADALNTGSEEHTGHHHHGDDWLAALVGHHDAGGKSGGQGDQRHVNCAVCNTLGALAGFAPAAGIALPIPVVVDAPIALAEGIGDPSRASPASYRSRAPPQA
jgi:hypothetical protein